MDCCCHVLTGILQVAMEAEVAMASNSSAMSFPGTFAKDIRLTPFY